jgi:hypothetical protein
MSLSDWVTPVSVNDNSEKTWICNFQSKALFGPKTFHSVKPDLDSSQKA